MNTRSTWLGAALLCLAPPAYGQLQLDWYTIDGGGGTSSGGGLSITGTIGQPDAAAASSGVLECAGGFWSGLLSPSQCYANCDSSTAVPVLNVADFICFLNKFAALDPYANCDASTAPPTLNVADFICFLNRFAAGCP
jgi:hypothetical protein